MLIAHPVVSFLFHTSPGSRRVFGKSEDVGIGTSCRHYVCEKVESVNNNDHCTENEHEHKMEEFLKKRRESRMSMDAALRNVPNI